MSLRRNRSALLQSEAPESGESPSAAVPPPAPRSITLTSRTTCSSGRRTIGFAARRTRRSSSRTSPRRRSRSSAAPTAPNTQVSRNSADNTDATQQTTPYRCTFRAIPELTATPGPGRDPPRPHEQLRHHYRRQLSFDIGPSRHPFMTTSIQVLEPGLNPWTPATSDYYKAALDLFAMIDHALARGGE